MDEKGVWVSPVYGAVKGLHEFLENHLTEYEFSEAREYIKVIGQSVIEAHEAILGLCLKFGIHIQHEGRPHLWTGGSHVLKVAFEVLRLTDPTPIETVDTESRQ